MVKQSLAARGIELTCGTIRRWAMTFDLGIAWRIRPTALARGEVVQLSADIIETLVDNAAERDAPLERATFTEKMWGDGRMTVAP